MKKLLINIGIVLSSLIVISDDVFEDTIITNGVEWTRRGSMGTKDYVITGLQRDPKNVNIDNAIINTNTVTVFPYIINNFTLTNSVAIGSELGIKSSGTRNYEIFVENENNFRQNLPIHFNIETGDAKLVYVKGNNTCKKLPVYIKLQQPTTKTVLISIEELNDDYDWTPIITNSFIRYSASQNKFYCENNEKSIEGTSLQCGTEFKIVYPINSNGSAVTNDFITAINGEISGSYFNYVISAEPTFTETPYIDSSATVKLWYDIIYKTVNGNAEVKHFELTSVE